MRPLTTRSLATIYLRSSLGLTRKGGVTLLSLNMWNYADLPGTMTVCDNERCSVDQKVSVAEKAITALLQCLNTGAVTATRRHRAGNRVKFQWMTGRTDILTFPWKNPPSC